MRPFLILVALATKAHANPAAAEKIFQDGKALLAQGKTDEACEAFRRSQQLEARVGTLLNLAECEERRGKFATAWVAWVDARALATRLGDARTAYAEQRASALAPKLSYLTMKVAAASRIEGFVVRRNGMAVPVAELELEVPVDPGHYDFDAAAPGFAPWKQSIDLTPAQRATIEIPALTADPTTATPTTGPAVIAKLPEVAAPSRRVGLGAAVGFSTDGDVIVGLRIPLYLASIGSGIVRAVPNVYYASISDPMDQYHERDLYALGLGIEYVMPLASQFAIAGGVGIGADILDDNYNGIGSTGWGALRLSPTVRILRSLDLGLHLQLVKTRTDTVGLATLGVDYFLW